MADEHTIEITPSTFTNLLTGKTVLVVKIRGVDVSLRFSVDALKMVLEVCDHACAAFVKDGTMAKVMEGIKQGTVKLQNGELVFAGQAPVDVDKSKLN